MHKPEKRTTAQFSLFPAPVRNQQLPSEVSPRLLPLVVRLLVKYADRKVTKPPVPEVSHE